MSYHRGQFRDLTRRIVGEFRLGVSEPFMVNLILGTAAQESRFGFYLRQLNGPALGALQIEPGTFNWCISLPECPASVADHLAAECEWDLKLSIQVAVVVYMERIGKPLPTEADNIDLLASCWKAHWNTVKGKGTVEEFKTNYRKYVLGGKNA